MKKIWNRIGIWLILLSMIISNGCKVKVEAGNGDTVEAFIKMFRGEELTKDDLKAKRLTAKDAEFFGVYVSNWYVPFYTSIGSETASIREDDEKDKKTSTDTDKSKTISDLVTAVTSGSSLSEGNAKVLVSTAISGIRNNSDVLDVYFSDLYNGKKHKVDALTDCRISLFISAMSGGLHEFLSQMETASPGIFGDMSANDLWNKYNYVYFVSRSTGKTVFDANYKYGGGGRNQMTACQQIFWTCYIETCSNTLDMSRGALAAFDLTPDDFMQEDIADSNIYDDPDDVLERYIKRAGSNCIKNFFDSVRVKVSPYGDIIIDGPNYDYIAIPACVNPYRWDNSYAEKDYVGTAIPMLSAPMLARIGSGVSKGSAKMGGSKGKMHNQTSNTNKDNKKDQRTINMGAKLVTDIPEMKEDEDKYTEQLSGYIGSGSENKVIVETPVRQTQIIQLDDSYAKEKWQSPSGYEFFQNPNRNNAEDKAWDRATMLAIMQICANATDGLGFNAGNISVDYDNGTWQLVNANMKNVMNMRVDNLKEAFTNHKQWETTATKSAKEGYELLNKSTGFMKGSRFKELEDGTSDFYNKIEKDIQGLRQTVQNDVLTPERLSPSKDKDDKDEKDKDNKEDKDKDKKTSTKTPEYTYTTMKFNTKFKGDSNGRDSEIKERYLAFPLIHGINITVTSKNPGDEWLRTLSKDSMAKLQDARIAYRSKNTKSNVYAVYSSSKVSDSEVYGAYCTNGFTGDSLKKIKLDNNSEYHLLTNYVVLDTNGVATDEDGKSNTFNVTQFETSPEAFDDKNRGFYHDEFPEDEDSGLENYHLTQDMASYIYVSYLFAGVGEREEELGYRFSTGYFPTINADALDFDLADNEEEDAKEIALKEWTYYLLHPTEGIDYIRIWGSNKIKGLLTGFHDDMLGTTGIGSMMGTTRYKGFTGLTTCPTLNDTPFTAKMQSWYTTCSWILIILCIIILILGWITNQISATKLIINIVIMVVALLMPVHLLNLTIDTTNLVSSSFYNDKFMYWALIQHQMYNTDIDQAAQSASQSYDTYLRELYKTNSEATKTQGSNSITVRWQAVKKLRSVEYSEEDADTVNGEKLSQYNAGTELLDGILQGAHDGQSFSETSTQYLYRNYIDIANNSRFIYKALTSNFGDELGKEPSTKNWTNADLASAIGDIETNRGYTNEPSNDSKIYLTAPLSSQIIADGFQTENLINTNALDSLDSRVGVSNDAFEFSQKSFNTGAEIAETIENTLKGAKQTPDKTFNPKDYDNKEYYALASYALMSESPYYYFSWYLYGQGLSSEATGGEGYKRLLIGDDNQGFFNMTKEDGTSTDYLKDYMDVEHLFKYTIPYLRMGNSVINKWAEANGGIYTYDNVPTTEGYEEELDLDNPENAELAQQYWNNINVRRLYNLYSSWVDLMDKSSYAKPVTVEASGSKYTIANPMDPYTYPENRPMVFSRAEAEEYGYTDGQLTDVELRIIDFEEEARKSLYELLNYSSFDDSVLNAAASMECLFAFNQAFSDVHIFNDNIAMYPTNFEIKDFSYDAYLRYILANNSADTVGKEGADTTALESMQQAEYGDTLEEKGFYQRIVSKGSIITAFLLFLNTICAQIVLPFVKYVYIIFVAILLVLELIVMAYDLAGDKKFIKRYWRLTIKPLLMFALILMCMSWVINAMMGNVNQTLTGGTTDAIQFGSPDIALLAMFVILGGVSYLLCKMSWKMGKDIVSDAKKVKTGAQGIFLQSLTTWATASSKNLISGISGNIMSRVHQRQDLKYSDSDGSGDDDKKKKTKGNKDDASVDNIQTQNTNKEGQGETESEAKKHADSINERIREQAEKNKKAKGEK